MSDTQKKKWSTKKKVLVIILCVVLFLFVATIIAGAVALNWYCTIEDYNIVSIAEKYEHDDVKMIAHRGFRATAPENTLPAYENAGKAQYWGAECDIYRTKDGVWVLQHDPYIYRMMDKMGNIENLTYDELMQYPYTNGNELDKYPDLRVTTLDEYLVCCEKYDMTAVIEFKGKNNTEHYDEVVASIEKYDCDVVVISFQEENLRAFRALSDVPMFYLAQKIEQEDIDIAKSIGNCGIDFNGNKEENFESDIIKQCIDEGLEMGAWTINDPAVLDKLVESGVKYITSDCIYY